MADAKQLMVKALKWCFLPHVRALGFKGSFPHLRRLSEERYDMLSIYFMPEGGSFVVEIAKCSPGQFEERRKTFPQLSAETLNVGYFTDRFRLCSTESSANSKRQFAFAPSFLDTPPSARKVEPYEHYCKIAESITPLLATQAVGWWHAPQPSGSPDSAPAALRR